MIRDRKRIVAATGARRLVRVGLVLASVVLTGAVVGSAASSGMGPERRVMTTGSHVTYQGPPRLTIFLVVTVEDAEALHAREAALASERDREGLRTRWRYQVLVAGNPVDEYIALNEVWETRLRWRQAGATGLEVVDLR